MFTHLLLPLYQGNSRDSYVVNRTLSYAEAEGFEHPIRKTYAGFQDQCNRPLCQTSNGTKISTQYVVYHCPLGQSLKADTVNEIASKILALSPEIILPIFI